MLGKKKTLRVKIRVTHDKSYNKIIKRPLTGDVTLQQNEDGSIYFSSNKKLFFRFESFEWNGPECRENQVTTTKKKGTIGRAAAGGILAGPVGALTGASTAKSSSKTETYTEERFKNAHLHLIRLDTNDPLTITILIKSSQAEVIYQMMEYAGVKPVTSVEDQSQQNADPISQLREYKQLLNEGIITQEEFDVKKKQLLDITE